VPPPDPEKEKTVKVRMNDGEEREVKDGRAFELVNTGAASVDDPNAVVEVPSQLVSEQEARLAYAETEYATPQEKRQAAVERQGLEDGVHARLHQTQLPALAVPDERHAEDVALDGEELWRNKGPVEQRPDSAGFSGLSDAAHGESVSAKSGPVKDVEVGAVDVPDVSAARKSAEGKAQRDQQPARPVKATDAKTDK
jgi:hypothetical protein